MTNTDDSKSSAQVKLAAPGAGLPLLQASFLRYLFFPAYCMATSWDKALKLFSHEGDKLTTAAKTLSSEQLQIPVLIRAPMGIEDSSRNWFILGQFYNTGCNSGAYFNQMFQNHCS